MLPSATTWGAAISTPLELAYDRSLVCICVHVPPLYAVYQLAVLVCDVIQSRPVYLCQYMYCSSNLEDEMGCQLDLERETLMACINLSLLSVSSSSSWFGTDSRGAAGFTFQDIFGELLGCAYMFGCRGRFNLLSKIIGSETEVVESGQVSRMSQPFKNMSKFSSTIIEIQIYAITSFLFE